MRPPLVCGPRRRRRLSRPAAVLLFFLALHSLVLGGGKTHAEHEEEAARGHSAKGLSTGHSLFAAAAIVVLVTNETLPDRIAAFGPRLTDPPGLVAQLISVAQIDPENQKGCRPLLAAVTPPPAAGPWIAMVERGGCSFIEKVRNMQASKANAVIVGDPDRNGLVTMFATGDRSDITIPSVFVAQTQYQQLRHFVSVLAQAGGGLKVPLLVMLVKEDMFQPMLDVIIITVITPVAMLLFIYALYRVRSTNVDRSTADLAAPAYVSSLPTKFYFATKRRGREPVDCAICLEDYVDEDELRILPCGHEFHVECIDPWLTKRRRCCPICKANVCSGEISPLLGTRYVESNSTPFAPGPARAARTMRNSQPTLPPRLARVGSDIFANGTSDPHNSTSSAPVVSSSTRFAMAMETVPPLSPNAWMFPALVLPPSYGALAQRRADEESERGLEERRGMPASGGQMLLPHVRTAFRPAQFADQ